VRLAERLEGRTRLVVPAVSLDAVPPPTSPVFFNPAASLNRDVTVAITAASGGRTFCDAMAGVGARGVRVANEVPGIASVTLVDFNRRALRLARRAASKNRVSRKCRFAESETSAFLFSRYGRDRRFDYVDVDPFGSPVGQLQGALSATSSGGVLSVTATDTAVLCGVYSAVAWRRYGGTPLNNHFNHETATRLLAGAAARIAASIEVGVEPVAAHSTRHYIRLYLRVRTGASKADVSLGNLGYIVWCPACGEARSAGQRLAACPSCGKKARVAGPLWVGPLTEPATVRGAEKEATRMDLEMASRTLGALVGSDDYPPWSFSIERACSELKVATVSESDVKAALESAGFRAMRTPYEKTGIKTDASSRELVEAVRVSGSRGPGT